MKELAEEFERQLACLGESTAKYITFSVPKRKELIKKEKILQKPYSTAYNLLKAQDLCQAQILLIILLRHFIKLNVKKKTNTKNENCVALNTKIATAFLNTHTLKVI